MRRKSFESHYERFFLKGEEVLMPDAALVIIKELL